MHRHHLLGPGPQRSRGQRDNRILCQVGCRDTTIWWTETAYGRQVSPFPPERQQRSGPGASRIGSGGTSRPSTDTAAPGGAGFGKGIQKEGRGAASSFLQIFSDHVAMGPYPAEMTKTIRSDRCRCCGSGEQQPRHRLFVKCSTWTAR